jgi:RHS repeat-associated protein
MNEVRQISSLGTFKTDYGFDQVGNQLSQTDGNSPAHTTTYTADVMGRRTSRHLPDGRTETYTGYDAIGNLTNKTDFAGNAFTYGYDVNDHLNSVSGPVNLGYTYDNAQFRVVMNDDSGQTTFNHNERNFLTKQTSPAGWGSLTFTNFPTGLVNTVQSSNSNGNNLTYGLDTLNRPATVFDGMKTTTMSYDPVGNPASVVMADGVTMAYAVDSLNRVTGVTVIGGSVLGRYNYTLGAAGNKIGVTELSGRVVTWTPDDLYRLTVEQITSPNIPDPTGSVTYGYDPVGNRLRRDGALATAITVVGPQNFTGGYDSADRLKPTFNFDDNGNQLGDGVRTFQYNALNQLTRVTGTGLDVSYVYDGDGLRVQKTNNLTAVTTRYLWDRNNLTGFPQVSEELQGGAVVRRYVYGPRGPLYQVQNTGVSWVTNYFVPDATGSIRLVLDDSGQITDALDYDGFGNILRRTGTTDLAMGWQGEYRDNDTGLIYLRARWYNPDLGRFVQMDDFEGDLNNPLSLHKYVGAQNNPVNLTDPTGKAVRIDQLMKGDVGNLLGLGPVFQNLKSNTIGLPSKGFYQDFSVDIFGGNADRNFLVVQFIQGSFKENGSPVPGVMGNHYGANSNGDFDFPNWTVDTLKDGIAEYPSLRGMGLSPNPQSKKTSTFIHFVDHPGYYQHQISPGTTFQADLRFTLNVYDKNLFPPNASAGMFPNPSNPTPLNGIGWWFTGNYP